MAILGERTMKGNIDSHKLSDPKVRRITIEILSYGATRDASIDTPRGIATPVHASPSSIAYLATQRFNIAERIDVVQMDSPQRLYIKGTGDFLRILHVING